MKINTLPEKDPTKPKVSLPKDHPLYQAKAMIEKDEIEKLENTKIITLKGINKSYTFELERWNYRDGMRLTAKLGELFSTPLSLLLGDKIKNGSIDDKISSSSLKDLLPDGQVLAESAAHFFAKLNYDTILSVLDFFLHNVTVEGKELKGNEDEILKGDYFLCLEVAYHNISFNLSPLVKTIFGNLK